MLALKRIDGVPTAFPAAEVSKADNLLEVVYDHGPVQVRSHAEPDRYPGLTLALSMT